MREAIAEIPIVVGLVLMAWLITEPGYAWPLTGLALWAWSYPLARQWWQREAEVQPRRADRGRSGRLLPGMGAADLDGLPQEATEPASGDS